jgi:hypothetical protein
MKKMLMIIAACAATALPGAGLAYADPAPGAPGPEPNGPKCWVQADDGHTQLTPCGWAYSEQSGWYQVPWTWVAQP